MKKANSLLMILVLTFLGINTSAQDKLTSYDNTFVKKTFDIQISFDKKGEFTLYINAYSVDALHETGGFMIDQKDYDDFISCLNQSILKYNDWVKTAKENNVTELIKTMPIKGKSSGYFLYGDEWKFDYYLNLTFDFKIIEQEDSLKYVLIVRSGEMVASDNEFMDVDGVVLLFISSEEIKEFIDLISLDKINEFKNKPKDEDLFK